MADSESLTCQIDQRRIGTDVSPFVIAELSGNHNGSLERALRLVEAAATAGADAIKLQTYTPDTMTLNLREEAFVVSNPASPWHGRSLYDLYREAATPWGWHATLFQRARELGLPAFTSPFDASAVDFLERELPEALRPPAYKIASFELVDLPLLRRCAITGKPLILSTGMATREEIRQAVEAVRSVGKNPIILLKCTSAYPATPEACNLRTLTDMRAVFNLPVGLSDHTPGIGVAVASVALGAVAIEKHLTLSRADGGVDAAFSMEPAELALLVTEVKRAHRALGSVHYGPTESETPSLLHRRSLIVTQVIPAGEAITPDNIRALRPGLGLAPDCYEQVLGRRVRWELKPGTPLSWDALMA